MTGRITVIAWLTTVWVALWGSLTAANIVVGSCIGTLLVLAFPSGTSFCPRVRPVAMVRLALFFALRLVIASSIVAWEVVTPRTRIREGVVAVPVRSDSDVLVTMVANAVSLTPGTLTLEVDRERMVLYVHVLHLRDPERVRADVRRLDELVIRAFAPVGSIAALAAAPAAGPDERGSG